MTAATPARTAAHRGDTLAYKEKQTDQSVYSHDVDRSVWYNSGMPATTAHASQDRSPSRASARERLLAAADELFYEEGVHIVGIDRVIERAGVAKASLYSAFGSKDELIRQYLMRRHVA